VSNVSLAIEAWESLFRAQVSVLRQLHAEFPTDEVSFNEYDVLFNLSKQPGNHARIRDLNRQLLLTQPSVSRLVDRLAAKELVRKEADPGDGRGTLVVLTDAGLALFRRVALTHGRSIAGRVGTTLTDDELRTLTELTTKLRGEDARSGKQ
jgi:DNA-binding MarR family transcriptional regulator